MGCGKLLRGYDETLMCAKDNNKVLDALENMYVEKSKLCAWNHDKQLSETLPGQLCGKTP